MTAINHPAYEQTMAVENGLIVTFTVGRIEPVPSYVGDAFDRVRLLVKQVSEVDLDLLRDWEGGFTLTPPQSRIVNPRITDAMRAEFIAAVRLAYPNAVLTSWENATHGVSGFSVRVNQPHSAAGSPL